LLSFNLRWSSAGSFAKLFTTCTDQGVSTLSSVLKTERAIEVDIAIMRTFVQLRSMLASNAELATKLARLEKKYDAQFKVVFDAIRELMSPAVPAKRRIGFKP